MAEETKGPKIGAGHAGAMWRQGLSELRAMLYSESKIAQPTEYGMAGSLTPGEVAESRRADSPALTGEQSSVIAARLRSHDPAPMAPQREERGPERD